MFELLCLPDPGTLAFILFFGFMPIRPSENGGSFNSTKQKKPCQSELSNRAIKSFSYTNAQQQSGYDPGCCFLLLGSIPFCLLLFLELF